MDCVTTICVFDAEINVGKLLVLLVEHIIGRRHLFLWMWWSDDGHSLHTKWREIKPLSVGFTRKRGMRN